MECHKEITAKYHGNVHELNAISCVGCHGGDASKESKLEAHAGGLKPVSHIEKEAMAKSCGECHALERDYFEKSPHQGALQGLEPVSCASCHDVHATAKSELVLFVKNCQECHEPATPAAELGLTLQKQIAGVNAQGDRLLLIAEKLRAQAVSTFDVRPDLDHLKELQKSLGPLSHQTRQPISDKAVSEADQLGKQLSATLDQKSRAIVNRRIVLGVIWLFILINLVVLTYALRRETTQTTNSFPEIR